MTVSEESTLAYPSLDDPRQILAFLTACVEQDEAGARAAADEAGSCDWFSTGTAVTTKILESALAAHGAHWDPARVLAEGELKRLIIKEHQPEMGHTWNPAERQGSTITYCERCDGRGIPDDSWPCAELRTLAAIYADRPGYQQAWSVA